MNTLAIAGREVAADVSRTCFLATRLELKRLQALERGFTGASPPSLGTDRRAFLCATRGSAAERVHAGDRTGYGWTRFVLSSSKAVGLMEAHGFIGPYKLKGIT
jgi:hypothetical protein